MSFARPEMPPAFRTRSQALRFAAVVTGLLLLPAVFRAWDVPGHEQRLPTAPLLAGPYSFLQHEIFEDDSELDAVFVGDSLMWTMLDTPQLAAALGARLGRPARVATLGWNWHGDDLTFYVLRDLLAHRRVGTVVLRLPDAPKPRDTLPHPQSYRWLTGCEHDPVEDNLPLQDRVRSYGVEVVGSLRNLLSVARANLIARSPYGDDLGAALIARSPKGPRFTFEAQSLTPPAVPASQSVTPISDVARLEPIRLAGRAYQLGYIAAIADLLERSGTHVVLIREPFEHEARELRLKYDGAWQDALGPSVPVLTIPPAVLYAGLRDEQVKNMYYDGEHFNVNGARYFTKAITPGLIGALGAGH